MTVINTNTKSIVAQNALIVNNRAMSKAMEQLSTGKRINSAKDDAAGLAIASTMTAQIRGLNQAIRNANDGVSLLQTAEGAMVEQTNMMQRMREIAVQSSNDTVSADQKGYLDTEYQSLLTEIDRIGGATQWNGENVLDATGGTGADGSYVFQVGANADQTITVAIGDMSTAGDLSDLDGTDITDSTNANLAITAIDTALDAMNSQRATLGAGINTLTYAADNLANVSQNTTASRSQVVDTDYAQTTTELVRQIPNEAALRVAHNLDNMKGLLQDGKS